MTREQYQLAFVAAFAEEPAIQIPFDDLMRIESELRTVFPSSFIDFATKIGALFTPSILNLVSGGDSEVPPAEAGFDVQYFFGADEILQTTLSYREAGMDSEMIAIASDSMGNVFGFRQHRDSNRPEDAALLIFDHEFCSVHFEAKSFDAWIASFVRMRKNTEQDNGDNSAAFRASP